MSTESFQSLIREAESTPDYWKRLANMGFVSGVDRLLAKAGIMRADLAVLAKKPESTISRNLNGKQNLTLATMVEMAEALGAAVRIHVEKKEIRGAWVPMEQIKAPPEKSGHATANGRPIAADFKGVPLGDHAFSPSASTG